MKIIVNTSTFKQSEDDPSPNFINNLLINMSDKNTFFVLYPRKMEKLKNKKIKENIFLLPYSYLVPRRYSTISKYGIYPSIRQNKLNILSVLLLITSQFVNLIRLCVKVKPDFIYSHWLFPQAFVSSIVGKIFKIKVVFTSHGSDIKILKKFGFLGDFVINFTLKNSLKFTSVSKHNLSLIKKDTNIENLPNHSVIPMGVDDIFYESRIKPVVKNNPEINILYYGRFIEYKGIDLLIEAIKILVCEFKKIHLTLIGSGSYNQILHKQIKNSNLEKNVEIIGFLKQIDLIDHIDTSDLVVIPSKVTPTEVEAGPLTLIEAMARGKVCIASDSIGFSQYLSNSNALIFKSNSAEELYQALLRGIELGPEMKKKLSKNSKTTSLNFRYSIISSNTEKFLFNKL